MAPLIHTSYFPFCLTADVQKRENFPVESKHMFHTARYSDGLLNTLGGEFSKVEHLNGLLFEQ